ncbi:MAG TPA: aminotransferase class I/II-fold pyridoxal phosphate-dependent enzyme [Acidimicrobiia bacterium]|jgi:threonine-phosphate decarboxylase
MIPEPGRHGGDGHRLAHALGIAPDAVLDLSFSVNPFAPDVGELVAAHTAAARTYPDPSHAIGALADVLIVDGDRLVLTNGGAEAIALVAAEWPVGRVEGPEFSLYERHLRGSAPHAHVWRSNPNNPTGRLARAGEQADVWDESFYPLATGSWTRGDDAAVVGSLTKVFACPGLRAGYLVAPDAATARRFARHQPEWSVNALACAVVPELLKLADLSGWRDAIAAVRRELTAVLSSTGLRPDPSDANYLLVRDAPGLRDHLARRAVLVRDTASFGIPRGIRIAVPHPNDLDRLANALEGYEWTP